MRLRSTACFTNPRIPPHWYLRRRRLQVLLYPPWAMPAGSTGAAVSNICTYPLALIITRLQIQRQLRKTSVPFHHRTEYKSITDAVYQIYHQEGGLVAFYVGLAQDTVKTIVDSFLFSVLHFPSSITASVSSGVWKASFCRRRTWYWLSGRGLCQARYHAVGKYCHPKTILGYGLRPFWHFELTQCSFFNTLDRSADQN